MVDEDLVGDRLQVVDAAFAIIRAFAKARLAEVIRELAGIKRVRGEHAILQHRGHGAADANDVLTRAGIGPDRLVGDAIPEMLEDLEHPFGGVEAERKIEVRGAVELVA